MKCGLTQKNVPIKQHDSPNVVWPCEDHRVHQDDKITVLIDKHTLLFVITDSQVQQLHRSIQACAKVVVLGWAEAMTCVHRVWAKIAQQGAIPLASPPRCFHSECNLERTEWWHAWLKKKQPQTETLT